MDLNQDNIDFFIENYSPSVFLPESNSDFTIGGMLAKNAWHFILENGKYNSSVCQELGDTLVALDSKKHETKLAAYIRFYQIRRFFISNEFNSYIKNLNVFRKEKGLLIIEELLKNAYIRIINKNKLEERGSNMAKKPKKNNVKDNKVEISLPENVPPESKKLIEALSELVQAALEYILMTAKGYEGTNAGKGVDSPETAAPPLEEEDLFNKEAEQGSTSSEKSGETFFPDVKPEETTQPPDEKKKEADVSREELEAKNRKLIIQLARNKGTMKAVEEFFTNFSAIIGYNVSQLKEIKTIDDLSTCYDLIKDELK